MTILWAGGEDTSYSLITTMIVKTSNFRAAFSRASVSTNAVGTAPPTTWPMSAQAVTPFWSATTAFWVHGQYGPSGGNTTVSNGILLALADSSGVGRILIRGTGTAGQIKISTRNAAGTIVDLVTSVAGAFTAGNPLPFDLFINYAVSGQCALYHHGVVIADTGPSVNVTTDGATTLAQAFFGFVYDGFGTGSAGWSECAVRTTSTLGMAIQTLPPVAAGSTQSWLPNTVGNVNPTAINDTNLVAAVGVNALSEWTVATALPTGNWTIAAVVQEARVSVGLTGPQHFEWLVRTVDGSDNVTGSVAPTNSFANYNGQIWPLNPHTGVAWLAGDLINAGIESLT